MKRIPESICIELLQKYQKEKAALQDELSEYENRETEIRKATSDVDEFIRRIKKYADLTELDRSVAMELIEYITVDRIPPDKSIPREIHIYYKLLDKPKKQTN